MQLKKIFVSLLVVIMILSTAVISVYAADDDAMAFSVTVTATENVVGGAAVATPGDTVKVDVKITNNPGAAVIEFVVDYDPAILSPIDADKDGVIDYESEEGNLYSYVETDPDTKESDIRVYNDAENGTIRFVSVMDPDMLNVTATGYVATIYFEVIASAEGETEIEVVDTLALSDKAHRFAEVATVGAEAALTVHNYVEDTKAADSCTGYKLFACANENCEAKYETVDPAAKGHVETEIPAEAPTCTEDGLTAGVKCSVCDKILVEQEVDPATGHTEEIIPAVAPGCVTSGLKAGLKCSVCDEILTAQEVDPATGHTERDILAKEPTCTEPGVSAGKECVVCGQITVSQTTKDPLGHNPVVVLEACAATCTTNGHGKIEKCDRCKVILTTDLGITNATGHTASDWIVDVEATCDSVGSQHKECTVCKVLLETATIDAKGHTASDWNVIVEATCLGEGLKNKVCTVCDAILEEEVIAAVGHTEVAIDAVAPTCTAAGSTAGVKCSVCELVLKAPEVVQPNGHTEEEIPAVEPTYSEDGSTEGKKCTVCGTITDATGVIPAKSLAWLWVLIAAVVVIGAGVAVYFFVLRKKK